MASKNTTLTRCSRKTIDLIKEIQDMAGLKSSRAVVDNAVGSYHLLLTNQAFNTLAQKTGIIHAKKSKAAKVANVRRSR